MINIIYFFRTSNPFAVKSDQFDIRINTPTDQDVEELVTIGKSLWESGNVKYIHISNVEIGTNKEYSSYKQRHIHIALVLYNYTTKRSIYNKFRIKCNVGWYLEPRDKKKTFAGWIAYHKKERTKICPEKPTLLEEGILPRERRCFSLEEKSMEELDKLVQRRKTWDRKKYLIRNSFWDQLDFEFPGFIYSSMGQSMKRELLRQSNDIFTKPLEKLDNYIIYGPSGSGKSSSVAKLYPNCYKKQKGSQYWDGYDKTNPDHGTVWIDEMSKETLMCLTGKADGGFEFLKELGDRYPVTVDEKYTKGFKIRPKRIIITMNEHPTSLLPDRAVYVNKKALYRKFNIMHVEDWLQKNNMINTEKGARFIESPEIIEENEINKIIHKRKFNEAHSSAIQIEFSEDETRNHNESIGNKRRNVGQDPSNQGI